MRDSLRAVAIAALILGVWQVLVTVLAVPAYILPPPSRIAAELAAHPAFLARNAAVTWLLYTFDAADEPPRSILGGRRVCI